MNGLGKQLLAGAGLARDEDGGIRGGDLPGKTEQGFHLAIRGKHMSEPYAIGLLLSRLREFAAQLVILSGTPDDGSNLLDGTGLGEIVISAGVNDVAHGLPVRAREKRHHRNTNGIQDCAFQCAELIRVFGAIGLRHPHNQHIVAGQELRLLQSAGIDWSQREFLVNFRAQGLDNNHRAYLQSSTLPPIPIPPDLSNHTCWRTEIFLGTGSYLTPRLVFRAHTTDHAKHCHPKPLALVDTLLPVTFVPQGVRDIQRLTTKVRKTPIFIRGTMKVRIYQGSRVSSCSLDRTLWFYAKS